MLSLLIVIAGLVAIPLLPVSEYPEVVPPTVVVSASPEVIARTVAIPLEESINGVEDMLYMSSQATTDGLLTLTVTFKLGMEPNLAQHFVQNRVTQAESRLREEVQRSGVTTIKSTPDLTLVVHLYSPNERYDMAYLNNYAILSVRDRLARIEGVGSVQVRGAGEYAMRVWLDPQKLSERGLTANDAVAAVRQDNIQAAAGIIGASPNSADVSVQMSISVQGRLRDTTEFGNIAVSTGVNGAVTYLRDVARIELGSAEYATRELLNNQPTAALLVTQAPGFNTVAIGNEVRRIMADAGQPNAAMSSS